MNWGLAGLIVVLVVIVCVLGLLGVVPFTAQVAYGLILGLAAAVVVAGYPLAHR